MTSSGMSYEVVVIATRTYDVPGTTASERTKAPTGAGAFVVMLWE
jgi:hypothetical protein